mmetsp:Transcript_5728/g.6524  ORF Transcript_5728/g.6524 Transcript_5728/m.6524 type:complete len:127 (+) Transcript_5728:79-459(+)
MNCSGSDMKRPVSFFSLPDALALSQHRANSYKDTEFNNTNLDHPLYTFLQSGEILRWITVPFAHVLLPRLQECSHTPNTPPRSHLGVPTIPNHRSTEICCVRPWKKNPSPNFPGSAGVSGMIEDRE